MDAAIRDVGVTRPRGAQCWQARCWLPCLVLAGLLVGCLGSNEDSPEACRVAVTQDLDAGRYDRALERLDSRACEASMSSDERELNRAAAFIGKAGYDFGDILNAILGADRPDPDEPQATQVLHLLRGTGQEPGGLAFLDQATAAHGRMLAAFPDGLAGGCRPENLHLLNDLQRDACFTSGLFAYARFVRGFDLLLRDELDFWLSGEGLTCANDRNQSGVLDQSEITACAISVRNRLDEDVGTCLAAGMDGDETTGAVTWERLAAHDPLTFRDAIGPFAELRPVRITVEAGSACAADGDRVGHRLIQEQPPPAATAVSEGFCEVDTRRGCDAADPDAGCWPCPMPRADRSGAMTTLDAVLDSINVIAEYLIAALPPGEVERYRETLAGVREEFCAPVEDDEERACEEREDGSLQVNRDALEELLRR